MKIKKLMNNSLHVQNRAITGADFCYFLTWILLDFSLFKYYLRKIIWK